MKLRRLPRLGTGAITTLRSNQLRVFQALADHATERLNESPLIVVFALVKPERLLIAVTEQMKRLDINIRSLERTLEQRPKVFQSVSVNLAACVALQMVNDLSVVIFFQIVVGH